MFQGWCSAIRILHRQLYSKSAPQQSQWKTHHVEGAIRSFHLLASHLYEPRTSQACLISHFLIGNELQIKLDMILLRKPMNQWSSEQNESFGAITPSQGRVTAARDEELWLVRVCCKEQLCQTANPVTAAVQCLNPAWSFPRMLFIKAELIKLRLLIKISLCKPNILPAKGTCQTREGKLTIHVPWFKNYELSAHFLKEKYVVCVFAFTK